MYLLKHICFRLTILFYILNVNQCIYQSRIKLSANGSQFLPVNLPGQLLSTFVNGKNLLKLCSILCNENLLCRIFDINGVIPNQCRIFQGDIFIHGQINSSSINNSQVGIIQYSNNLYSNFGQTCYSNSSENRYLICGTNKTWACPQNTYWNQSVSMCQAQSPLIGSICQQNLSMCRQDLGYTCLIFNQCGPLSLLLGTTIADNNTIIAHSSTIGLVYPYSITMNKTTDNSIIVTNSFNHQVIRFYDNNSTSNNASLIAQNWTTGNSFSMPFSVSIHPNEKSNVYVSDYNNHVIIKLYNMQVISPLPSSVAGVNGISGTGTNRLKQPAGITVDNNGNILIADSGNHRVILWPPNSTIGSVIAGLGSAGNSSSSLNTPRGIFLDENNSYVYVSDTLNHRIQRFSLAGGSPNNGSTVAGGNGQGSTNKQFNSPFSVYVSKKTQAIYIADSFNHRIQRWSQGAQSAVTIAGDPNGNSGANASMLSFPYGIALNDEETFLHVVDTGNNRVQRFQIV